MIFTVYWEFNLVAGKRARGAEKVLKFYKSLIKLNWRFVCIALDLPKENERLSPVTNFELIQILLIVDKSFRLNVRGKYTNIQSTLINSHATLVLVWLGHESRQNSHANFLFSTLINSHATLVLVWPGHESWKNSHGNSRLSTLINSHATLVLVWPGHESWENSSTQIEDVRCILVSYGVLL